MGVSYEDREDGVSTSGASGILNITTSPSELKVGASILEGRISLLIRPLDGDIWIGFSSSVASGNSGNGFLLKRDEVASLAANNSIWAVSSSGTKKVSIMEFGGSEVI